MSQIPNSWTTVEIEHVLLHLANGNVLQQGWSPQCHSEPALTEDEWGVLKTTAIQEGLFLPEHNKKLPNDLDPRPQIEVIPGDILMTCAGPRNRCGVTCLVKATRKRLLMSGKMYRFRNNPQILNSGYLEAFLLSQEARHAIDEMKTGINDSGLNLTHDRFKKLQIPVAPLPEQHRIVAKIEELFSELDKGIENLKTARAQLKVYRQALLKHAFEGKLTAQWRAERSVTPAQKGKQANCEAAARKAGVQPLNDMDSRLRGNDKPLETADALLKRIQQERAQRYQQQLADWEKSKSPSIPLLQRGKPTSTATSSHPPLEKGGRGDLKPKAPKSLPPLTKEELAELPELPKGWGWEKNENYLFEIKDGTHDTPKYVDNGIPFVTQKNIKNGKLSMDNVTYISTEDHEKFFKRSNVQKGDLIISMIGHGRGECCLVDVDTAFSIKNVGLFKFFSGFQSSGFLKFYFQSTGGLNLALSKSKGGAQPFIGLTELRGWPVPVCSLAEQDKILEEIESRLSEVDNLELTIATSLQQAEALRQSILKKAFSGQLVPQDPHDEPASAMLARIKEEREKSPTPPFAKGGRSRSGGGISAKPRRNMRSKLVKET